VVVFGKTKFFAQAEAQQEFLAPHGVPSSGYKPKALSRRPSTEDLNQTQPGKEIKYLLHNFFDETFAQTK